jgi:hypothetical protein
MKEKELKQLTARIIKKFKQSQEMGCWAECLKTAEDYLTDLESDLDHEINKESASFEEIPMFKGINKQLEGLL